ncbi:Ras-related protein Rab-5B [Tritrichomonas foetus]|uniref:Ras-related protein Rab-5B n=1 Tax=Tritrichomonas foetus TaxID=1144522 RepID=A0A1J4KT64_9EUKA|nr:Ras-related protein Rab-5B [Tritrichomonas foetus]|eukprot:OHT14072.1 Ras-related protein Rab-5B [Tritrichomonas foetus]
MKTDAESPEFKVVLIGDAYVGKTSIINRFYRDTFNSEEPPTIAAAYLQIPVKVNQQTAKLNIWDTAGHERFHCIVPLYARTADVLIVVFDITNSKTYQNAKVWFTNLSEEIGKTQISFLVGNKADLDSSKDCEVFSTWATENNIFFESTSALSGKNIDKLFSRIAEELLSMNSILLKSEKKVRPAEHVRNEEGSCC